MPEIFSKYPYDFAAITKKLFAVAADDADLQVSKRQLELDALDHFLSEVGVMSFVQNMTKLGKAFL